MNTNKKIQILFLSLFLSLFVHAQKNQLTIEDGSYMNRALFPKRISQLKWMGNSDNFSYVANNKLVKGKATSTERDTIMTIDDLNAGLTDLNIDSLKRLPSITYLDDNKIRFTYKKRLFVSDIISKKLDLVNEYVKEAANVDIHPKTNAVAYTIDNNLFIAVEKEQLQITNDEDKGIVNGQSVHRQEFGIYKGIFWSPEGDYLAFYRKDETMVGDYPLVNIDSREATVKNTKYPMAGMTSEEVTLGVYDLKNKKTIFLKTGEPKDQYLTSVTWGPNEKYIYIAILNRDQNHLWLNQYDVATGGFVKTLFEEESPKYVEPEHPLYFLKTTLGRFVWFSERDGYNHLYMFNTDGEMIKQLTKGNWVVTQYLGTDPKEKKIFFQATKESPLEKNIYSVEIKSGTITRLTPDHGTHSAMISYSGEYLIDSYSSTDIAREIKVGNSKGKTVQVLLENADPLSDYNMGEMSIFKLKADDDADLYCRMIKPVGFDSTKKYPVLVYVYGGPHAQLITDSWLGGAGLFLNHLASDGYVVFTLDNHGSANRGLEFEQAVFRNLGTLEIADQMKGVEYLRSLNFIDTTRIGVDGWSYGGFMTISLMLREPEVYKVGCAGGPVIDWKYYEIMYGERYMDTPETNPEGYYTASLLNYAKNLEGKLLVIHGTMDATVVWQHSLQFIKQCVTDDVQVDYFPYPGHGHGVGGKDRLNLNKKIKLYFDENL